MAARASKLTANFLYLSGAEVASKVVTFAAIAYLARVVGPAGYGYVEFAASVMLCAGLVVDQGFGPYGAREIAREPARTAALVSEIVTARFALAVVAYAAVVAFALLLGRSPVVTRLILIYGLSLLTTPLLLQWVFQGHNRMDAVAAIQLLRQLAFAVVVFAFVRDESQVWIVGVGETVAVTGAAAYGVWAYRRRIGGALRPTLAVSRRLFREGVPIGLSQMFWMTRMFGATVVVGIIASAQDVGFFGGAMRILVALHAFVWLYYFNLLPSFAQAWQRGDGALATLIARSLRGVAWVGVAGGLAWALLAPTVVTAAYGSAFAPGGVALQWLAGVCVVAGLSGHYRYGLIAAGQQTVEMAISALGAAFAVVLIPVGYSQAGVGGAAMGLLAAELVVWWAAWWMARERLGLVGHLGLLVRPAAAAAVSLTLVWLLPTSSTGVRAVAGVASVGALALLLDAEVRDRCRRLTAGWRPWARRQPDERAPEVVC